MLKYSIAIVVLIFIFVSIAHVVLGKYGVHENLIISILTSAGCATLSFVIVKLVIRLRR